MYRPAPTCPKLTGVRNRPRGASIWFPSAIALKGPLLEYGTSAPSARRESTRHTSAKSWLTLSPDKAPPHGSFSRRWSTTRCLTFQPAMALLNTKVGLAILLACEGHARSTIPWAWSNVWLTAVCLRRLCMAWRTKASSAEGCSRGGDVNVGLDTWCWWHCPTSNRGGHCTAWCFTQPPTLSLARGGAMPLANRFAFVRPFFMPAVERWLCGGAGERWGLVFGSCGGWWLPCCICFPSRHTSVGCATPFCNQATSFGGT